MANPFMEICLYDVKPTKVNDFDNLLKEVSEHHDSFSGVIDIKYIKKTHRFSDFNSVKAGEPAIRLTRKPQKVKYVLCWELDNEIIYGKITQVGLDKYYKRFNRCLLAPPNIILGERII